MPSGCCADNFNSCNDTTPEDTWIHKIDVDYFGTPIQDGGDYSGYVDTSLEYVAMGDSFSSGEGLGSYFSGTATSGVNMCHRSTVGYPMKLDVSEEVNLNLLAFVACSGAITDTIFNGGTGSGVWSERPQIDAVTASTEVVTITIGGNDLGFAQVAGECAHRPGNTGHGCSSSTPLNDSLTERLDALSGTAVGTVYEPGGRVVHSVLDVIEAIDAKADDVAIYIAGYPRLFGSSTSNFASDPDVPGGYDCTTGLATSFAYDDAVWMNTWADDLNDVIQAAVTAASGNGIDVTYVSPAFGGHGHCDSGTTYLNITYADSYTPVTPSPESLHPNSSGVWIGYQVPFEYMIVG